MNMFETLTSIYGLESVRPSHGQTFAEAKARAHAARAEAILEAAGLVRAAIVRAFRAFAAAAREQAITHDLMRLDDRTLRDIGVDRSAIPHIARLHAWPVNDNDRRLVA